MLWKYALFAFGYLFSQCISTFALTLIEMERQGNAQTSPVFVEDLENLVSRVTGTLCTGTFSKDFFSQGAVKVLTECP